MAVLDFIDLPKRIKQNPRGIKENQIKVSEQFASFPSPSASLFSTSDDLSGAFGTLKQGTLYITVSY